MTKIIGFSTHIVRYVIPILLFANFFVVQPPNLENKFSLIYSNPLFLRGISPTANSFIADRIWFLTKYIDEIYLSGKVDREDFFKVYRNLLILDPSFEMTTIYSTTYLASIQDRADLAVRLLQLAQKLNPRSFQYLFTELIFQIAYLHSSDLEYLKNLAYKSASIGGTKIVGRIRVDKWSLEIIQYLQKRETQQKLIKQHKEWLRKVKK